MADVMDSLANPEPQKKIAYKTSPVSAKLLSSLQPSVACADTIAMLDSWLPTYATMMLVNQAERAAANGNTSRMNDFSEHAQFR